MSEAEKNHSTEAFAETVAGLRWAAKQAQHMHGSLSTVTAVDEGFAVKFGEVPRIDRVRDELAARGWQLLPVPRFMARRTIDYAGRPALEWEMPRWVAIPPEGTAAAARTFRRKRDAVAWARSAASLGAA